MDRASFGSALNSTAGGPPSPSSLRDSFRLRRGRMRGKKDDGWMHPWLAVTGEDLAVRGVRPAPAAASAPAAAAAAPRGVHRRRLDQRRAHAPAQREVEVGEHDVAVVPDQHVLRLEVPVHDPQHVQVLHGEQHLGDVEPGGGLGEVLAGLLLAERVEVAAAAVLHDEAVELVGLEVSVERGEEGVVEQARRSSAARGGRRRMRRKEVGGEAGIDSAG